MIIGFLFFVFGIILLVSAHSLYFKGKFKLIPYYYRKDVPTELIKKFCKGIAMAVSVSALGFIIFGLETVFEKEYFIGTIILLIFILLGFYIGITVTRKYSHK